MSEPVPPADRPPRPTWLRPLAAALLAIAFVASQWWIRAHRDDTLDGELVRELRNDGHLYALYFHREARYFNTIRKDGALIFDSRSDPRLQACIHELVVVDGDVHRRCYLFATKKVDSAPLP